MDINISKWERLIDKLTDGAIDIALKLLLAVIIYLAGRFIIGRILKAIKKLRSFRSIDPTAEEYIITFIIYIKSVHHIENYIAVSSTRYTYQKFLVLFLLRCPQPALYRLT